MMMLVIVLLVDYEIRSILTAVFGESVGQGEARSTPAHDDIVVAGGEILPLGAVLAEERRRIGDCYQGRSRKLPGEKHLGGGFIRWLGGIKLSSLLFS